MVYGITWEGGGIFFKMSNEMAPSTTMQTPVFVALSCFPAYKLPDRWDPHRLTSSSFCHLHSERSGSRCDVPYTVFSNKDKCNQT